MLLVLEKIADPQRVKHLASLESEYAAECGGSGPTGTAPVTVPVTTPSPVTPPLGPVEFGPIEIFPEVPVFP